MSGPIDWHSNPRPSRPAWAVSLSARGDAHRAQAESRSRSLSKVVAWLATDPPLPGRYGAIAPPRPTSENPPVATQDLATREPNTRYIYRSSVITPYAPNPLYPDTPFAPGERDRVNGQHQRWVGADTKLNGKTVWPYNNLDLMPFGGGGGSPSPTPSPEPQTPNAWPFRLLFRPFGLPFPRPDSGKGKGKAHDTACPKLPLNPTSKIMQLRPLHVHFTSPMRFQPIPTPHPDAYWVGTVASTGVMVCPNEHLTETAWRSLGRLESAHRMYYAVQNSFPAPGDSPCCFPGTQAYRARANSTTSSSSNGSGSALGTRAAITTHAREFNANTLFPATMQHRLLRDDYGLLYLLSHWDVAILEQWIVENARKCGLKRWAKRQNRRLRHGHWWHWNLRARSPSTGSESSTGSASSAPSVGSPFGAIGDRPAQSVGCPFGAIGERPPQTVVATATRTMTNTAGGDGVARPSTATNAAGGDGVAGPSTQRLPPRPATAEAAEPTQPAQRPAMRFATTPIGGITFRTTNGRQSWSGYHSAP
ncbi:hypothetical protein A1Q2_03153 [Trichosporon asahii var. asahii CBS 8904]|uniref:Uncharacterized protein n=1 Tax=Trichosporon asahii var. asahii (strain CBS 8904) TaxID=1220162 RepID=K1VSL8_TRIAC|nr:hypothetical protein A1Q2_03153 [Trichosporon asahii var. asahii CBS 8904]